MAICVCLASVISEDRCVKKYAPNEVPIRNELDYLRNQLAGEFKK